MNTTYLTCSWKLVFLSFLVVCNGAYNLQKFDLGGGVDGPESIAFDCKGQGPYVGVSDGRILKWHSTQLGWLEFSIPSRSRDRKACDGSRDPKLEPKCGRPLGLKFSPSTCELYIADAYFGLMVVGPEGRVAQKLVTTSEEGLPFSFLIIDRFSRLRGPENKAVDRFLIIVGAEWWSQDFGESLPIVSWVPFVSEVPTFKAVLYLMIAFAVIPTIGSNVMNVNKVVQARKGGISMALALAMIYPFMVLMGGILVWGYLSPFDIMGNYPHLVVLGTGLAFGFLVGRMILAHLCDEPKGLKTNMCMSLLYLPLAVANALTAKLNDGVPLVDEVWVLLGYCSFTVGLYLHFATSVIHEITTALGISCFRITRKEA